MVFPFEFMKFDTDDLFSCRLVLTREEVWEGKLVEFAASFVWEGVLSGETPTLIAVDVDLREWSAVLDSLEYGGSKTSWREGGRVDGLVFGRENPFCPGYEETDGWYVNIDGDEGRYSRLLVGLYFEPDPNWFGEMRRRLDLVTEYVAARNA